MPTKNIKKRKINCLNQCSFLAEHCFTCFVFVCISEAIKNILQKKLNLILTFIFVIKVARLPQLWAHKRETRTLTQEATTKTTVVVVVLISAYSPPFRRTYPSEAYQEKKNNSVLLKHENNIVPLFTKQGANRMEST